MKDTENRPPSRKRRKWGSVIVRRDTVCFVKLL